MKSAILLMAAAIMTIAMNYASAGQITMTTSKDGQVKLVIAGSGNVILTLNDDIFRFDSFCSGVKSFPFGFF
jgi:hypothetical protein